MEKKRWKMDREPGGINALILGSKPEQLPKQTFISITRGEGLNVAQLIINQILNLIVMNQMKKTPGLLYSEIKGEIVRGKGNGGTMTVWDGKTMPKFRNKDSHGIVMKFFGWVIHRKNTKAYYLTYTSDGTIPSFLEAIEIVKQYGKFYDGGKLVRTASPPNTIKIIS
ncbi:hypothetical protein JOC85_003113 [Bacillus mesophilus]|uniref:Uncharacterized protein n=1 Tax=Bacillus mesophilus TaxID=1808955 RepID=A0A6M0Q9N8_9BACI|nr:hypothetical protein [Bacillus mesophilus]MBM7662306.1 hypothetical protein [Bacillus mesophilus]NEY73062.1 hypothetical protein [Bacillus mesophilus]